MYYLIVKGIVLAGGTGSRLFPITLSTSKQLLSVYDKPMIYYPLGTLMLDGVRDFVIVCNSSDQNRFEHLLGNGSSLGIQIVYAEQVKPNGIAESFIIADKLIANQQVALVLGDNIFHGSGFGRHLRQIDVSRGAHIFGYEVSDPGSYGIVSFDKTGKPNAIEEKPRNPKSNIAIPGLYFYDNQVLDFAKSLKPSKRGELEITDINLMYLQQGTLTVSLLPRGTAWLDTGTTEALHDASTYVRIIEQRQGMKLGCLEEISWRNGWINDRELETLALSYPPGSYRAYLENLLRG